MGERSYRAKTREPEPHAEGDVRLISGQVGPRWIVRVRLPAELREAGAKALEAKGLPGEIIDTEQAFAGDDEVAAFDSAEGWLRERYQIEDPDA